MPASEKLLSCSLHGRLLFQHSNRHCVCVQDMFAPDVLATLQPMPVVLDVLDFILVRNPLLRPTAAEVTARCVLPCRQLSRCIGSSSIVQSSLAELGHHR